MIPEDVIVVSIDEVWRTRDAALSLLTAEERAQFASLKIDKRRRDWLAGRIAAKRAVQRALGLPLERISVLRSRDDATRGRPEPRIAGTAETIGHVSISHAGDV